MLMLQVCLNYSHTKILCLLSNALFLSLFDYQNGEGKRTTSMFNVLHCLVFLEK